MIQQLNEYHFRIIWFNKLWEKQINNFYKNFVQSLAQIQINNSNIRNSAEEL